MPYFAYIVGGWVQKEGKFCLRNKSMAPKFKALCILIIVAFEATNHSELFCLFSFGN